MIVVEINESGGVMDGGFSVFFDTEFTTLDPVREGYQALISIGCVAEDGREFYAELTDTWQPGICSEFVVKNVLPQLQGGNFKMSETGCAFRLKNWIERLTNSEVILRTDQPRLDWPWVEQLFQFNGSWPQNLRRKPGTIYFEDEEQQDRYLAGMESYWKENSSRQHHALVDARSIYYAWNLTRVICD